MPAPRVPNPCQLTPVGSQSALHFFVDKNIKKVLNNPGNIETARSIGNQMQTRQIYVKLANIQELQTFQIEKTGAFAYSGIWNQCKEYIYLSIIPEKLIQLKIHSKYIKELCDEIYPVSDEYMLADVFF